MIMNIEFTAIEIFKSIWTANRNSSSKVDKKDKIFEKIVSEYAKHTKH